MSAQKSKPIGVLGAIAGLVGFSALAGVLVTAMITPALAVASVTTSSTVGIFEVLPDYVTINEQSQRNTLWATQGGAPVPFAQVYNQNRQEVAWDQVSPFVKDATLAAEDVRFYQHGGVDLTGIVRAAVGNVVGGGLQGASTLSQQLVKNLYIQEALTRSTDAERKAGIAAAQASTIDRKLREAKLAIGLEKRYTKQEILLGYLNIAGFGGNTYGIESAAQQYYSTTAKDLTLAQAASLVAIVQQPTYSNPGDKANWERNQGRRDAILGTMLEKKMVTQAQYDEAIATPVNETTVKISPPQNGCLYAKAAKQFCDYVVRNVDTLTALGANPAERLVNWKRGGYDVYTTIDLDQQANAEAVVAEQAPADETQFQLGGAISTVQVGTGRILIMAQNKAFDNSEAGGGGTTTAVNYNTDRQFGGSSGFQTGSTYKLFTLVNWLQNGRGLNEIVDGNIKEYPSFPAKCAGGVYKTNPPYKPNNFTRSSAGQVSILKATALSINAAFINMASKLDLCDIQDTARSMGVHRADGAELVYYPSAILGTNEIAPLTMANAYATIASGGILCQPIAVDKVVGPDKIELVGQTPNCNQAIAPEIAAAVAYALAGVMKSGGTGIASNPNDGTPLIGKTGTTDESIQTWVATASSKVASAVWVGNIVGTQSLANNTIGSGSAANARHRIMKPIQAALDASPLYAGATAFPDPPRALLTGTSQAVPNVAGQTVSSARSLIQSLGLSFAEGSTVPSELPVGRVVASNPGAGSLVSKGTLIEVVTSDGSLAVTMPNVVGMRQKEAKDALSAQGFDAAKVSVTYVKGDPKDLCKVTASDPASGAPTSKAASVSLTVNGGDVVPGVTPNCA